LSDWFDLPDAGLPGRPGKEAIASFAVQLG